MRRLLLVLALASSVLAGCARPNAPQAELPATMAALGDSITRAFSPSRDLSGDQPEASWAEAYGARLREAGAPLADIMNLAQSGARVSDLPRQADRAVEARAEHVTILIGGNDACTQGPARMTSVDAFRDDVQRAFGKLERLSEGATVYVLSIPDVHHLWEVHRDTPEARHVWRTFRICQSILGENVTADERSGARGRVAAYNAVLREEAEARGFAHDGGAVFLERFGPGHVSDLDYWHPSRAGQARLAELAWAAGPYGPPATTRPQE